MIARCVEHYCNSSRAAQILTKVKLLTETQRRFVNAVTDSKDAKACILSDNVDVTLKVFLAEKINRADAEELIRFRLDELNQDTKKII